MWQSNVIAGIVFVDLQLKSKTWNQLQVHFPSSDFPHLRHVKDGLRHKIDPESLWQKEVTI